MTKKLVLALSAVLVIGLMGCSTPAENTPSGNDGTGTEAGDLTLEQVNHFLNDSSGLGAGGIANVVQVIPHAHIDGPKNETPFYAFVNFKYTARDYIKYQVTYLSCTCRSADVNFWQTAYMEMSLPASGNIEDAVLRNISFDTEPSGHYLGGFWGDSDPTPAGISYETFKTEFLPFFEGKNAAYLEALNTMWDIEASDYTDGEGRSDLTVDTFSGSSVSANNIIRIINAVMDYHATDEFFQ